MSYDLEIEMRKLEISVVYGRCRSIKFYKCYFDIMYVIGIS